MIRAMSSMWSVAWGKTSGVVIRNAAKSSLKRSSQRPVRSPIDSPAAFALAMIRSSTSVTFIAQVTRRPLYRRYEPGRPRRGTTGSCRCGSARRPWGRSCRSGRGPARAARGRVRPESVSRSRSVMPRSPPSRSSWRPRHRLARSPRPAPTSPDRFPVEALMLTRLHPDPEHLGDATRMAASTVRSAAVRRGWSGRWRRAPARVRQPPNDAGKQLAARDARLVRSSAG